jgi:hypothetical protein
MSGRSASALFVSSLRDRLTDPSVLTLQILSILVPLLTVRQLGVISPTNPVLALLVVPLLITLSLFLPVGLIQDLTLRLEAKSIEEQNVFSCWQSIATRLLVWINAAVVIPVIIWGLPITGTLGYTVEAAPELVLSETVAADHTLTGTVVIGLVLLGGAWAAVGLLVSGQMFIGPNLAHDRIQMYLGLRSSLPTTGSASLAPLRDGSETPVDTAELAYACVKYTLTRSGQNTLPDGIDIERIIEQTTPQPASRLTLSAFFITLNRRFLSILFGGMTFFIAVTFGIELGSIRTATVLLAAVIGPVTQLAYRHPFVTAGLGVLG